MTKAEQNDSNREAIVKAVFTPLHPQCTPVWGSCALPSGHKGQHSAYAPKKGKCKGCGCRINAACDYCGECLCEEDEL